MKIEPTVLTATLTGVVAALAWPFLWSRFGGPATDGGIGFVIGMLLVIALPAHAFVVGFRGHRPDDPRKLDTALLKRVAAWMAAAAVTTLVGAAWPG